MTGFSVENEPVTAIEPPGKLRVAALCVMAACLVAMAVSYVVGAYANLPQADVAFMILWL